MARRTTCAELELERRRSSGVVGVLGLGSGVDRDRHAVLEREPAVPGQVVGMRVGLDDAHDLEPRAWPPREYRLDRIGRIDDRGDAGLLVADEVRRAPEVVVEELLEEHGMTLPAAPAASEQSRDREGQRET